MFRKYKKLKSMVFLLAADDFIFKVVKDINTRVPKAITIERKDEENDYVYNLKLQAGSRVANLYIKGYIEKRKRDFPPVFDFLVVNIDYEEYKTKVFDIHSSTSSNLYVSTDNYDALKFWLLAYFLSYDVINERTEQTMKEVGEALREMKKMGQTNSFNKFLEDE
jgi:hypothetical protein